jgi:hypothetical protein
MLASEEMSMDDLTLANLDMTDLQKLLVYGIHQNLREVLIAKALLLTLGPLVGATVFSDAFDHALLTFDDIVNNARKPE